ncbi:MAG: hypothetical protein II913_05705 [Elusimicrobiaceae bacterium]|nr:hypothetical protein [Elusimicrobiaceae bacterium]
MAFDFNKLKQRIAPGKTSTPVPQTGNTVVSSSDKPAASNTKMSAWKQGLADVKAVFDEGKYQLFVKQFIVVLLAFLGVRFLVGKLSVEKEQIVDRVSAISIQQTNQDDYLANKSRLLRLEPLFPDVGKKNEWLVQTLMKAFSAHQIQADINGNVAEKVNENYTMLTQDVTFRRSFADVGKFLADVESGDDFLRISGLTITKLMDAASLGDNTVNVRFNTVFPREKYAKRLFKDYAQQMKQIEAETAAQEAAATGKEEAQEPATEEKADAS